MRHLIFSSVVAASSLVLAAPSKAAVIWQNETNAALEADYCNLQFPSSFGVIANTTTPTVYGRVYEFGVTEPNGPSPVVSAQLGYGPAGTDPRTDPNWLWFNASFNISAGNDDEYQAIFTAPAFNGTYSFTYRISLDGGASYTAADLDGAGSNAGLTFDPFNVGVMTVTGGVDVPEPASLAMAILALPLLRRRK